MKEIIVYGKILVIIVGLWLFGYMVGVDRAEKEVVHIKQVDTLIRVDTIRYTAPPETHYEVLTEKVLVPIRDTVWKHDTLYVSVHTQLKSYKDKDFYLEISGVNPSLEYIEVYPRTETRIQTERVKYLPKNKMAIGIRVGYINSPIIPAYLEYERLLRDHVAISGRLLYDIPSHKYGVELGVNAQLAW